MTDSRTVSDTGFCSFCGKPDHDVAKIIAGPGIYICDECVALCNDILTEEAPSVAGDAELVYWQGLTDQQMLDRLPRIAAVATQVEAGLLTWVRRLRMRGVAWTRIGASLQMTRQSAWERFSGED